MERIPPIKPHTVVIEEDDLDDLLEQALNDLDINDIPDKQPSPTVSSSLNHEDFETSHLDLFQLLKHEGGVTIEELQELIKKQIESPTNDQQEKELENAFKELMQGAQPNINSPQGMNPFADGANPLQGNEFMGNMLQNMIGPIVEKYPFLEHMSALPLKEKVFPLCDLSNMMFLQETKQEEKFILIETSKEKEMEMEAYLKKAFEEKIGITGLIGMFSQGNETQIMQKLNTFQTECINELVNKGLVTILDKEGGEAKIKDLLKPQLSDAPISENIFSLKILEFTEDTLCYESLSKDTNLRVELIIAEEKVAKLNSQFQNPLNKAKKEIQEKIEVLRKKDLPENEIAQIIAEQSEAVTKFYFGPLYPLYFEKIREELIFQHKERL